MNELIEIAKNFWGLILLVSGGIGGYFKYKNNQKVAKYKSTEMLYEELERLKQKVILQVSREVDQASELAEKKRLIEEFKLKCPGCYSEHFAKNYEDGN